MSTQKSFKATQGQKDTANTLILAMAYLQTIRPELEKIQQSILDKYQYKWDLEKVGERLSDEFINHYGEYCKSWNHTYMISDKDFAHCLTEYHCRFTEKGFKVKEMGYCPLLVAESTEREARNLLIDEMECVTNISHDDIMCSADWKNNMDSYIDLTLKLLSPYLKNILQAA